VEPELFLVDVKRQVAFSGLALLFVVHNPKKDNAQTRDQTQKTPPDYAQAFNAGEHASGEKMQQMIDAAWQAFREVGQEWEMKGWSPTRSVFFPTISPFSSSRPYF